MPNPEPVCRPDAMPPSTLAALALPLERFLRGSIFFFLCLFAVLLPHSVKGAQHSWQIAFVLWLAALLVERKRPFSQPLSAPILAYVIISAISTCVSPDPMLSWDRMKIVCLVLVGVVFAQALTSLRRVRLLVFLLIASGVAATLFTAWQYTYGIGIRVNHLARDTPLYRAGFRNDDIITAINGVAMHRPSQLEPAVRDSPSQLVRINYYRVLAFEPLTKRERMVTRDAILESGLAAHSLQLRRGTPVRAQGTLYHYVVFAEMLLQVGCMTWAMLLAGTGSERWVQALLSVAFGGIVLALMATETRSVLAGLIVGCTVGFLAVSKDRSRRWALGGLAVLILVAAFWVKHTRGFHFADRSDPGTNFRLLMWEDGWRLFRQHPWFGIGMETVHNHWQQWNIRAFALYHVQAHFHSDMIQIAVERGIFALAAWLWFVVAYLWFLLRLLRLARQHSQFATAVVAGVLSSFVAWQSTALVHYNLGEEPLVMIFFFYFGIAVSIERMLSRHSGIDVA